MRFLRKSLTGMFLLALTLGLLTYSAILVRDAVQARLGQEPRGSQARERSFAVNVVPVRFGAVSPVLSAFGEVQSRRTLELRASTRGRLIALADEFVEGGQVVPGQLLARIDPAQAQAGFDRAESDLLDAQAEQREANRAIALARDELDAARQQAQLRETALQRQKDLLSRGVGSASAVETAELALSAANQVVLSRRQAIANAEARIDQAATRLRRSQIALREAQRELNDTEIRAGFAGTLSAVSVVQGRRVSVNEKLGELVDTTALEVAFRVSTQQYARLLDGQGALVQAPVTISLETFGTDIRATGQLDRESAQVGEGQTGRVLFATLDNPRGFKPGDFVTVSLSEPELSQVARLPATAVGPDLQVLVIGEGDRLTSAPVEILRRQGDDVLIRAQGLEGREVVAQRTPLLGAGIRVKPLRPGAQLQVPEMVRLSDARRAKIRAFVEGNARMPGGAKRRILKQIEQDEVPAAMVARIEQRMGG